MVRWLVFLGLVGPALAVGPAGKAVLALTWQQDAVLQGDHAPQLVRFRGGHALRFRHERRTRLSLGHGENGSLRLRGALTIAAIVQLHSVPKAKTAILSRWHTVDGGRSYGLGVDPQQRVFFAVSASGRYDSGARELFTHSRLRVGRPYAIVAVFDPGRRMTVFVNGVEAGRLTSRVPRTLHDAPTPVLVGNRPGGEESCGLDGILAGVWLYPKALAKETIVAWTQANGLTEPPEPEFGDQELPPVRAITRGPKFHWFAYYDKLQFDPTCRYVLGMEVDFEGRSPTADDIIRVGMVDLKDGDRWIELGTSRAWCWQQGCMLQWRPSSRTEVLWNDREGDRFVCHILDVATRRRRTVPHPVYTVSPDGRAAVSPDFRRIQDMRPGYGYPGLPDPHKDEQAPAGSGIFRIDLDSGKAKLIASLADIAKIPYEHGDLSPMKHYVNHLLVNTDGTRFEFLHRWRGPGVRSFGTRMLTADLDGRNMRVVDGYGRTSHFIWRDPTHILAWAWHPSHKSAFYLYEDADPVKVEGVGIGTMARNGHCTYLPGSAWILNDTYPDSRRLQHPYLYHVATGRVVWLGHFHSPPAYRGEWRCDLHPRSSPDGRFVCVDSTHGGEGRQLYLLDISQIVANPPQEP